VATAATIALACWYTPLFFILTRARSEFAAAIGGVLLTIAVHAWLAQFWALALLGGEKLVGDYLLMCVLPMLNPLAGLVLAFVPQLGVLLPVVLLVHILLWIVLPVWYVRRRMRKAGTG